MVASLRTRAQRRLTRSGGAVLAALFITGMMSPDTDNNVAYQAMTPIAALMLIACGFVSFFRGKFRVERRLPRFATVGKPFRYRVSIQNLGRKRQAGLTLLEVLDRHLPNYTEWVALQLANERQNPSFRFTRPRREALRFTPARSAPVPIPTAEPGETVEAEVEMTPLRRGPLHFAGVAIARTDPLGLMRSFIRVAAPQSTLILPRRYLVPPIALPGTVKYQEGGVAFASNVGQSDEFVSLRDYRTGDPMRHIHWRTWARIGKPVVREFEDEFFVRHALVLDTFTSLDPSELFEEAVSVAASFACTVGTQESLLDLLFVGPESYCFTAGRGVAHGDRMLEILASVRACREDRFRDLERLVLDHAPAVSGCICVLLAWDEQRREFIRKLRMLGVPVLVLLLVEEQQRKAFDPGPLSQEPEHFQILRLGEVEKNLAMLRT
jgi:uncharacterized protein (DUF58 family)